MSLRFLYDGCKIDLKILQAQLAAVTAERDKWKDNFALCRDHNLQLSRENAALQREDVRTIAVDYAKILARLEGVTAERDKSYSEVIRLIQCVTDNILRAEKAEAKAERYRVALRKISEFTPTLMCVMKLGSCVDIARAALSDTEETSE